MKKFISENWYKLMTGSSLVMASFGFMVYSISPAIAGGNNENNYTNTNYRLVPTNPDGSINVMLSNKQLNEIIPKNADGSINVRMEANALTNVNIAAIGGNDCYSFREGLLGVRIYK